MSNTRNFYLRAEIDGRKSELTGGPASKDGGMYVELLMRSEGKPVNVLRINCTAYDDGCLRVHVSRPSLPDDVKFGVEVYTQDAEADKVIQQIAPKFSQLRIATKR